MVVNQFVESMKRVYVEKKVTELKIVEFFLSGKITEEEKEYILDVDDVNDNDLDVK